MKAFLLLFALGTIQIYSQGFICAIGGGSENYNDWSDEPYSWIVQKADSGKVIILGVDDNDSWLPNYFISLGADTAYNKKISSINSANLQSTFDEIISANAIFIRGGDQWDYIRTWKGTLVDSAINTVYNRGGVIAGTSAGAAVLGDIDFSAASGTVYPDDAILFPFNSRMKFESDFLRLQKNVLFDTHFIERGRFTRLIAMIYNLSFSMSKDFIGVGIDDRTAICISPDGIGEVMGSGSVAIIKKDDKTKFTEYDPNGFYTIENLKVDLLTKNWKYDFINNQIHFIPASAKNVDYENLKLQPKTDFVLTGSDILSEQSDNVDYFLMNLASDTVLFITHPGFLKSSEMINYLQSHNVNYSVLNLSNKILNDKNEADKIKSAKEFIIWGDSLQVLSLLNKKGTLIEKEFSSALMNNKKFLLIGNSGKLAGEFFVDNTDKDYLASYRGKMIIGNGISLFDNLICQPRVFESDDFYENRVSALFWGLMRNRKQLGVLLNKNNRLEFINHNNSIKTNSAFPSLIIDCSEAKKIDSSVYRAKSSIGTRQVVAMNNLRVSLTKYDGLNYLIDEKRFDFLTEVKSEKTKLTTPTHFDLSQNYPNPFGSGSAANSSCTNIEFSVPSFINEATNYPGENNQTPSSLSQSGFVKVTLKIFDVLGREIRTLVNDFKSSGEYEISFDASYLASGVYFYRLQVGSYTQTKKMTVLK